MASRPVAREKLDAIGIDALCERISDGESMSSIARSLGMQLISFRDWLELDDTRFARAHKAMAVAAYAYAEQAQEAIEAIDENASQATVARQRELASHLRWKAKMFNRSQFGDKVTQEVIGDASRPVLVGIEAFQGLSRDEIAQLKAITDKALGTALINGTTGEVIDE